MNKQNLNIIYQKLFNSFPYFCFYNIGYIDRVRTLQNENHKLYHQVRTFEEYKQTEINNVKDLYDKQVGLNTSEKI